MTESLGSFSFTCRGFSGGIVVENLPANAGDLRGRGSVPGSGRSPGERRGSHSSVLAWRFPGTEEPGELWSTGPHRIGHS